jgi:hypothetical protein
MKKTDALEHFETVADLARAAKVTRSAVSQWGDLVPPLSAKRLELATGGKLSFDPDLYDAWNKGKRGKAA